MPTFAQALDAVIGMYEPTWKSRELKPSSQSDYQQKFRRALAAYLQYLGAPASWKYPARSSGKGPSTSRQTRTDTRKSTEEDPTKTDSSPKDAGPSQEYGYPFRPDFLARLVIPRDATTEEVNRLIAWVRTLAVDYKAGE